MITTFTSRLSRIQPRKEFLMQKSSSRELKSIFKVSLDFTRNKKDLPEVTKEAKKGLKFEFVKNTSDVLKIALNTD